MRLKSILKYVEQKLSRCKIQEMRKNLSFINENMKNLNTYLDNTLLTKQQEKNSQR